MTRPSPATERTVALLNFLASRPGESFSLSELARRLDLNKSTAFLMVNSLVESGYLLKNPIQKAYSLGPALIAVGSAAARQFAPVDHAADEMRRLAEELSVQCVAGAVVAGEIVMLACAGEPKPFGTSISPGQRLPLAPPLGTVYMAWASAEEIEDWLKKLGPDVTQEQKTRFINVLDDVRKRGYATGLEAIAKLRLSKALGEVPSVDGQIDREQLKNIVQGLVEELTHEERVLSDISGQPSYHLSHISAPVFGPDGKVKLALNLIDLPRQLSSEQVKEFATCLLAATARITQSIGGTVPLRSEVA